MLLPLNIGFQTLLASRQDPEKSEVGDSNTEDDYTHDPPTNDGSLRRSEEHHQDVEEENYSTMRGLEYGEPEVDEEDMDRRRRRRRGSSISLGLLSTFSSSDLPSRPRRPQWYHKLKAFIFPPNTNEDIDSYIPTYRYIPIISGLVIPFSILLEIPGLTEHWYIRTIENEVVETKPNTLILNVGLALSMACGLIANIAIIARFLEKRVKLMTLTCVAFLTIHDIINITAVTVFGVEHRFDDGFTYGTSFWMTLCSTIASSITNATLIADLIRTPDFATSGSGLTRKQRSLIIIVIFLLCYIAFGFGDIVATTAGARVFTCVYATFGIVNLALAVALARETVIEALEVGYRQRLHTVRERRKHTRWFRRVSNKWREGIEWRLREEGKPIWIKDNPDSERAWFIKLADWIASWMWHRAIRLGDVAHPHGMHLNLEALTDAQLEAAALEAGVPLCDLLPPGFLKRRKNMNARSETRTLPSSSGLWFRRVQREIDLDQVPLTHARIGRMVAMLGGFALAVGKSEWFKDKKNWDKRPTLPRGGSQSSRRKLLEHDFDVYRAGIEDEERKDFWAKFSVAWMLFIIFWMIGSGIFTATEGWTFGQAMYFCFISFTTIGYGDFSPKTPAGRSIFVVWALFGVATMTILISLVSEAFTSRYKNVFRAGIFTRAVEKYRTKESQAGRGRIKPLPASPASSLGNDSVPGSSKSQEHEAIHRAKQRLEQLPRQIIQHCKAFHDHMHFVSSPRRIDGKEPEKMPPGIKKLLEDIAGAEKLGSRIQNEILQDRDARQTLFTLSIERKCELRKMIEAAEEALAALEHRDKILSDNVNGKS
ncbi:tandem pore domain k+ channel [Moniliophthora roreri]|nr:tandem pore domain k+ channel [Moniliophthora roreri]